MKQPVSSRGFPYSAIPTAAVTYLFAVNPRSHAGESPKS
jgi:hypothetical protein